MKKLIALVLVLALALGVSMAAAEKAVPDIEGVDLETGAPFHAAIGEYNAEDKTIELRVYAYDKFDEDDVKKLTAGDVILAGGDLYVITDEKEIDGERVFVCSDGNEIYFEKLNGSNDDLIARTITDDRIFMNEVSVLRLPIADNAVYEDDSDPNPETAAKVYTGLEEVLKVIEAANGGQPYGMFPSAVTVTLNERMEIVKIHQAYDVGQ